MSNLRPPPPHLMTDQMKRVSDWLKINMLTLNVSKTNYMVMNNRGKKVADAECNIEIYGKIIERISQCKFDNKLTWKCHIDYICPSVPLITLYNSLLNPYFTYCINIWGNTF